MPGPLEGLRVVDLSCGHAGPRATGLLADYGADVVWVEPPGGDPFRAQEPAAASVFSRSKRSVIADLARDDDLALVHRLADRADVVVTSWPGGAAPQGLDAASLRDRNPGLVYCALSDVGPVVPDGWPESVVPNGNEAVVQSVLGTFDTQAGLRPGPIFQGLPFAALGASYLALIGILAALYRREDDRAGRDVETSLVDGALAYHSMMWGESDESVAGMAGPEVGLKQTTSKMRLITRSFECGDGEFLGIHTGAVGAFGRLLEVLGLEDRVQSSETGMDIGIPLTDSEAVVINEEVPEIFATRPRAEWVELLFEADVCAVEHLRPTEVYDTPQARHNDMVVTVEDPVLGAVEQVAPAAKFSITRPDHSRPAPVPGEDTVDVAASTAGWAPLESLSPATETHRGELLEGVRILDFGAYYAGPYSSRLLADLGAEVIKVEGVLGDQLRGIERPFYSAQANKRSLAANLKDERLGRAIRGLLEWAGAVHHNLRPGAAERLGLDYESVRAVNPGIVYLYAPGWGSTGPFQMRQSFAPMLSGYVGVTYEVAGELNPPMPPVANEDPGNGLLGAAAILMGLLDRRRGGDGQYVENPQLNATMTHLAHIVRRNGEAIGAGRLDPLQLGIGPFERLYETADGWITVEAGRESQRSALGRVLDVDVTGGDDVVAGRLGAALGRLSTDRALEALIDAGVPAAVPTTGGNHRLMNDPRQRLVNRVAELPHPKKGNVRELATLIRVGRCAPTPHRLAPELGEHTEEILGQLGYSAEEIGELRADGAIS